MPEAAPKQRLRVGDFSTDPWAWSLAGRLPNPSAVLERMGGDAQRLYDRMELDAHVMGELRAVRAGLLSYEVRISPGDDSRAARRAAALAEALLARPPSPGRQWTDVTWTMAQAVFRGYAVHDLVWERDGAWLMPAVEDRPQRRFAFDRDGRLLELTRRAPWRGEEAPPMQAVATRHMPTAENPYGAALFDACVWPYLFKHSGMRYFVQFCQKYGVPWPVGKYPAGAGDAKADEMLQALNKMVRDGALALPDDSMVDFPTANIRGQAPQERLIELCNREISKALTSQTLATEIQGQGSRAASETHLERERWVAQADRAMISASYGQILRWLTDANFGTDVPSPNHSFYEEAHADEQWARVLDTARRIVPVRRSEAYDRLGLSPPAEGEAVVGDGGGQPPADPPGEAREMSQCPGCGARRYARGESDPVAAAAAAALDAAEGGPPIGRDFAAAILAAGPDALAERLGELLPAAGEEEAEEALARILFVAELAGGNDPNG